ncbi:hypothetical protein KQ51_00266 [Candidatus Izimaplasma bacterium HR1]|jgi:hypothetical protein|uniref:hypothetical protein n=1 Tax=Candidatus Izimoplasma sp. HR1 TaxID=1541959 RepID=UPI0004F70F47|nr:hypothetical protein KQ51_00266 [Candidatus Izimaplasma bacterium HR1]
MERINKAFLKAKRNNLIPVLIMLGVIYILYFSIIEYTLTGIIICSVGLVLVLFIITMNIMYNFKLLSLRKQIPSEPEKVHGKLVELLSKIDKSNARYASNAKSGSVMRGGLGTTVRIKKEENMLKRNKVAGIIYELNLYIKNNIK